MLPLHKRNKMVNLYNCLLFCFLSIWPSEVRGYENIEKISEVKPLQLASNKFQQFLRTITSTSIKCSSTGRCCNLAATKSISSCNMLLIPSWISVFQRWTAVEFNNWSISQWYSQWMRNMSDLLTESGKNLTNLEKYWEICLQNICIGRWKGLKQYVPMPHHFQRHKYTSTTYTYISRHATLQTMKWSAKESVLERSRLLVNYVYQVSLIPNILLSLPNFILGI